MGIEIFKMQDGVRRKKRKKRKRKTELKAWGILIFMLLLFGLSVYGIFLFVGNLDTAADSDVTGVVATDDMSESQTFIQETDMENTKKGEQVIEDEFEDIETDKELQKAFEETANVDEVEQILQEMTLEEKIAQMFFVTPETLTGVSVVTAAGDTTKAALEKYPVGGLIYFEQNLINWQQTETMLNGTQEMAMEKRGLPIFLGVDEEGGRVLRIGSNDAYNVEKVDAMGDIAKQDDPMLIHNAGNNIGSYLCDLGFNVDFAPVADVLENEENEVIGDRSFGSNPDFVAQMAWEYAEGLNEKNVLATYKHFPGHGGTTEDSHTGKAYLYKTLDELKKSEIIPFQDGAMKGVDFIMASHVSVPNVIGDDTPTSLSATMITDILRNDVGYEGIIITDSLRMNAISGFYSSSDAAVKAILAGNDMLLMPADFEEAYNGVLQAVSQGILTEDRIDESVYRIIEKKLEWKKG